MARSGEVIQNPVTGETVTFLETAGETNGRLLRLEMKAERASVSAHQHPRIAERWDLNTKTVYAMIERGELAARRCGRVIRVPRHVVESFEQASVAPGGNKPCR